MTPPDLRSPSPDIHFRTHSSRDLSHVTLLSLRAQRDNPTTTTTSYDAPLVALHSISPRGDDHHRKLGFSIVYSVCNTSHRAPATLSGASGRSEAFVYVTRRSASFLCQDMQCVENCGDPDPRNHVLYEQPVWQTLQMFRPSILFSFAPLH